MLLRHTERAGVQTGEILVVTSPGECRIRMGRLARKWRVCHPEKNLLTLQGERAVSVFFQFRACYFAIKYYLWIIKRALSVETLYKCTWKIYIILIIVSVRCDTKADYHTRFKYDVFQNIYTSYFICIYTYIKYLKRRQRSLLI